MVEHTQINQNAFVLIKKDMAEAQLEIQSRLVPETHILYQILHP